MEHGVVVPKNLLAQHVTPPQSDSAVARQRAAVVPLELLHEASQLVLCVLEVDQLALTSVLRSGHNNVRHGLDLHVTGKCLQRNVKVRRQRHVIIDDHRIPKVLTFASANQLGDPVLRGPVHRMRLVSLRNEQILDLLANVGILVITLRHIFAHLLRAIHRSLGTAVVANEHGVGREQLQSRIDCVRKSLGPVLRQGRLMASN
mmetsp:Transcript_108907/g.264769  ORF Transcript_108907/g.264769 Transcript_108907/m.264769 type:complete len:203 (-) Transcript_108907:943-1551(-)